MGFLKSLFGNKKNKLNIKVEISADTVQSTIQSDAAPMPKTAKSVQEIVLLTIAGDFKIGEQKYPGYLRSRFGIGAPNEIFQKLEAKGYIRPSTIIESLPHLKAAELKAIASKLGLKTGGKKEDLCLRIAENAAEEVLQEDVQERYWIITDKGKSLLEANKHITFYMENHPYSLEAVGLNISTYAKLFSGSPAGRIRDVIWGELNRRSLDLYSKGMNKGEFEPYCELLYTMALFLEEENRHKDALEMYVRYLHYRANFEAGLSALKKYRLLKNIEDATSRLYIKAEILPFIADDIQTMSTGCGFDSRQLHRFIKDSLSREIDTGLFSPGELTDLIMCGLNGDRDGQKKICKNAMKSAAQKLNKKR